MIENRTAGKLKPGRRSKLLTNDSPFPLQHNILQFYSGGGRGKLLKQLSRHFCNSEEPFVVEGEHGSGKTMLGLVLEQNLGSQFLVLRYSHLLIDRTSLMRFLIAGIDESRGALQGAVQQTGKQLDSAQLSPSATESGVRTGIKQIKSYIEEQRVDPKPILLLLDTPAALDHELLALLVKLQEIKINGYPVFNVLFLLTPGQRSTCAPILDEMVPQINRQTLARLSLGDVHDYLQHHMLLFDYNQRDCFTREMSYFIADKSEGVYGAINELARNAFRLAAMNNCRQLALSHLMAVGAPPEMQTAQAGGFTRSSLKFAFTVSGIVVLYLMLMRG